MVNPTEVPIFAPRPHVRFGSEADMCSARRHVRFTPKSGRNSGHRMSVKGRALLCPDLRRYGEGIVHINAEIPHSALYRSVTKRKLDGAQIPGVALRSMHPVRRCRLLRSQSGVKRTCLLALHMSASDPKRTSAFLPFRRAKHSRYDVRS
jgi:hypothetical protein